MKKFDVLVVGSGPAGNTTAIYTVRSGFSTGLITGNSVGGQLTITTEIENFPGFPDPITGGELMERVIKQSENLGVEIFYDSIKIIDFDKYPYQVTTENDEVFEADNLVLATGAGSKWLGLDSEKEFLGYGVSGCAICDGNFFRKKIIAVVGGGRTAAIEALHMSHLAEEVYLIHRGDDFSRVEAVLVEELLKTKNIKVFFNSNIKEIIGDKNPKKVTAIILENTKKNTETKIDISAVFVAIGRQPDNSLFKDSKLPLNEGGYVITEPDSARTNLKRVYAVGDITNKPFKQAIVAAGFGCIAALEIQEDKNKK